MAYKSLKHICVYNATTNSYHGYKTELLDQELDSFAQTMILCTGCRGLLREPCLTDSGYRCSSCLQGEEGKLDETKIEVIHKLSCHCAMKKKGCEWDGLVCQLLEHIDNCAFAEIPCAFKEFGCETKRKRQDMETHEADSNLKHIKLLSEYISTMKEDMKRMEERIATNEQMIKLTEGLEWRIDCVRRKMKDNFIQLSKYFYVEQYKFQASVNFSDNKLNALRVFIHVCPGEFDGKLNWPFDAVITLILVSSKSAKRSITAQIKTAEYKDDFSRQIESKSTGRGFRMAEEEYLLKDEFSKSDEIIIRIIFEKETKCKEI